MVVALGLPKAELSTFSFIGPNGGQTHDAEPPGMDNISLVEMEAKLSRKSLVEGHLT